jgi:hypothetical protein
MAVVADALDGSSIADVKAPGPVHAYVAPTVVDGVDVKFNVAPSHIGELLDAVIVGIAFIVIVSVSVPVQPFASVTFTVTVYVPAAAAPENVGVATAVLLSCAAAVPLHTCVVKA